MKRRKKNIDEADQDRVKQRQDVDRILTEQLEAFKH